MSALLPGRNGWAGKRQWLLAALFGLAYMLAEHATFSASNMLAFGHVNAPQPRRSSRARCFTGPGQRPGRLTGGRPVR